MSLTACLRYRGDGADCTGCSQPLTDHIDVWRSLASYYERELQRANDHVIGLEMVKDT